MLIDRSARRALPLYDHSVEQFGASRPVDTGTILLVSMPFGPLKQPSIGLSLLKAGLLRLGIPSEVLYLTLRFAEKIGEGLYEQIAQETASFDLVGEWLFSSALLEAEPNWDGYIEDVLQHRSPAYRTTRELQACSPSLIENLIRVQNQVAGFLDECARDIVARRPFIVGFTSVFQQQAPTLALAKRIKAARPETHVLMGGANCEGVMGAEVVRQFPFVDAIVSGEGDLVFPELVQRLMARQSIDDLSGVYTRRNIARSGESSRYANAPSVQDMNGLPVPDYDDFFSQLKASGLDEQRGTQLLFETSRGCWWGEKSHCTFCGLNGSSMAFRSKSAKRALDELLDLSQRYPTSRISVVDNILDYRYLKEFVPELAARDLELELFYEVKSNLRKDQVRLLRDAGITQLQPGIESLSSEVLRLMRKGVKGIQNVQLLKWCKELGVEVYWNVLWGFPQERPEEYARMAQLVPLLTHLPPPRGCGTIRLDRFSPNFDGAEQMGFTNVEPYPAYRHIYQLGAEALANLAYYFTFAYREPQDLLGYTRALADELHAWRKAYETSDLFCVDKGNCLVICDLRPMAHRTLTVLSGIDRTLYMACDAAQTAAQLESRIQELGDATTSIAQIEERLQALVGAGSMLNEESLYLSLAIPLGEYAPERSVLQGLQSALQSLGRSSRNEVVMADPL